MTDRKARLAALAAKAGRNNNNNDSEGNQPEETAELKFRNYTPVLLPTTGTSTAPPGTTTSTSISSSRDPHDGGQPAPPKKAKTNRIEGKDDGPSILEKALEKARKDSASAAAAASDQGRSKPPETQKKINWDLKRDIQPKLDRLEKRTQKAIVSLLKQRLETEAAAPSSSALD